MTESHADAPNAVSSPRTPAAHVSSSDGEGKPLNRPADEKLALDVRFYRPFDQDRWLPEPPWKPDLPALVNWERAHGHDVRLKCYVEFGCQAVEYSLEAAEDEIDRLAAEVERLRAQRDEALALHRPWYEINGERHENRVSVVDPGPDHVCLTVPGGYGDETCDAETEADGLLPVVEAHEKALRDEITSTNEMLEVVTGHMIPFRDDLSSLRDAVAQLADALDNEAAFTLDPQTARSFPRSYTAYLGRRGALLDAARRLRLATQVDTEGKQR